MNQKAMLKFRDENGEDCAYCTLCGRWRKESSIRKFLGKNTCTSCYLRFKVFIEGMDLKKGIKWFFGRLNVETKIEIQDTGAMKIKISTQKN